MTINNDEKVIATYKDGQGSYDIIKASNGKIFNRYMPNHGLAGPFKNKTEAIKMMQKHRPSAIKVKTIKPKLKEK